MSRLCPAFGTRRLFFSLPFDQKTTFVQNGQKFQLVFFVNKSPFEQKSAPKSLFFTFALFGQKLSLVFFLNRSSFEHKYLPTGEPFIAKIQASRSGWPFYCSLCVSAAFIISRTSACLLGGTFSQSSSISRIAVTSFSSSSSRRR